MGCSASGEDWASDAAPQGRSRRNNSEVRIGPGGGVSGAGGVMNYQHEEFRLIAGMAGVVLVTSIVLLAPLVAELLRTALL